MIRYHISEDLQMVVLNNIVDVGILAQNNTSTGKGTYIDCKLFSIIIFSDVPNHCVQAWILLHQSNRLTP